MTQRLYIDMDGEIVDFESALREMDTSVQTKIHHSING
jgi:hypothetical protein